MMKKLSVRKANGLLALALAIVLLVGSLAYFTDRVTTTATITTASNSVDITPLPDPDVVPDDPTNPNPGGFTDPTPTDPTDDLTKWWSYINPTAQINFNPGDKLVLDYILANQGSLAVDIRETFVITSSKPLSATPEFRLFSSFNKAANGCNTGVDVVAVEERVVDDGTGECYQYRYTVAPFTMSGTGETVGESPLKVAKDYYVVFDAAAGNPFQGATCTVEYVVEAKQHSDAANQAAEWAVAATATMSLGDETVNVVQGS